MRFSEFRGSPNTAVNHQAVTIGATPQTLVQAGLSLHADTRFMRIMAEGADVRAVMHGTANPDPANGFGSLLYDGDDALLTRAEADTMVLRRNAATDAKIQVEQFKS